MTNKNIVHPLQTPEWAEFRKAWGNETARVGGYLLTIHHVPVLGKIGIFEKGPAPTKAMLEMLINYAKGRNLIFIKLEPNVRENTKIHNILLAMGAVPGKTLFTPSTFWIDLTKSEEELLKSFSSKTRYNIRLAERHGVTVEEDNSDKAFEKYLSLMKETVTRQGFYAHNRMYHTLMWQTLKNKIAHLLTAKYNGEIIATWILFAHDGFLYYPYGASSSNPKYYRLMPSALLMWEAIKFGKGKGLKTFDLWGREAGRGFTKFKEGFSPEVIEFVGTWDLVINKPKYWLYRIADFVRWQILRIKSNFIKPTF